MSDSPPRPSLSSALTPVAADMRRLEDILRDELASEVPRVAEVARYIVAAGGKRLRPALFLLFARALGADDDRPPFVAAIIEMLHTATLMHDDVVDAAPLRRGRPTASARWGNEIAVLVGDYLYTRSFQMLLRTANPPLMKALTDAANRLSEGEVMQLEAVGREEVGEEGYLAIIERKTGALFSAAAGMAVALTGAGPEPAAALHGYARHLGRAFQIADDLLDYADPALTGKESGVDLREGKMTLPVIYALRSCDAAGRNLIKRALAGDAEALAPAAAAIAGSGALEACRARARAEAEEAGQALSVLPDSPYRQSLLKLADIAASRGV